MNVKTNSEIVFLLQMLRKLLRKRYVFSIGQSYKHGLDLQGKVEESRRLTWGASARNQDLGFKVGTPG